MKQLFKVQETKEFYQTPSVDFLDLESEGTICAASGDAFIEDWEDDEDPITI